MKMYCTACGGLLKRGENGARCTVIGCGAEYDRDFRAPILVSAQWPEPDLIAYTARETGLRSGDRIALREDEYVRCAYEGGEVRAKGPGVFALGIGGAPELDWAPKRQSTDVSFIRCSAIRVEIANESVRYSVFRSCEYSCGITAFLTDPECFRGDELKDILGLKERIAKEARKPFARYIMAGPVPDNGGFDENWIAAAEISLRQSIHVGGIDIKEIQISKINNKKRVCPFCGTGIRTGDHACPLCGKRLYRCPVCRGTVMDHTCENGHKLRFCRFCDRMIIPTDEGTCPVHGRIEEV